MTIRIIVLAIDPYGNPRAHALGPESEVDEIRKRAVRECQKYVAKRNDLGEALTVSDFTFATHVLEERL